MDITLDENEVRVLGALVEKDLTTPDQYPLSLNALAAACNQKSNREPVMNLHESEVRAALDALTGHALVNERHQYGSRVTRHAHRLSSGLGLRFKFSGNALGVLCILMLRGPQTPGEIRSRTNRLGKFAHLDDVTHALEELINADEGPYATRLERRPGFKEQRFAHLLAGSVTEDMSATPGTPTRTSTAERMQRLEDDLTALRADMEALSARLAALE